MATNILMPALSPTMEEGKLAKWHVKEGDTVKTGDILAEIETDKATMEFEAIDEGRIGKILVAEGTEGVKVNATIAVLLAEGESADASPSSKAPPSKPEEISSAMSEISKALASETASAPATPKAEPAKASAQAESGARVFASPLAKRIAANKGVDLSGLTGSGPRGRIVKADVESRKIGRRGHFRCHAASRCASLLCEGRLRRNAA
jgi:pyruvate dehydrogenase E2 component (dihydrolipoamide acetyltransferase)